RGDPKSWRKPPSPRLSAREAPSIRPSPPRPCGASSAEGTRSVAAWLSARSDRASCKLLSDGLLAAEPAPEIEERMRTRRLSQNASNRPSNLSQSDLRAENKCLNAERSSEACCA